MSRNVQATKKPYCKVCFDAGKPESEYTSHWVRTLPDRSGKTTVTCPTLLNTECRYCYQSGHTTKFCKVLEKQNKDRERAEKAETATKKTNQVAPKEKKASSAFAGLMDSDSDEEEEKPSIKVSKPVENFPVLCEPVKKNEVEKPKQEAKSGWAAIAAKPAPPMLKLVRNETIKSKNVVISDLINIEAKIEAKTEAKVAPWVKKQPVVTKSWADESDSEDECELEEPNWNRENDNYDPYKPYAFSVAQEDNDCDDYDEDLKWRNTYVPGMSDEVWARVSGEHDSTW
jgi:hypothetical protein